MRPVIESPIEGGGGSSAFGEPAVAMAHPLVDSSYFVSADSSGELLQGVVDDEEQKEEVVPPPTKADIKRGMESNAPTTKLPAPVICPDPTLPLPRMVALAEDFKNQRFTNSSPRVSNNSAVAERIDVSECCFDDKSSGISDESYVLDIEAFKRGIERVVPKKTTGVSPDSEEGTRILRSAEESIRHEGGRRRPPPRNISGRRRRYTTRSRPGAFPIEGFESRGANSSSSESESEDDDSEVFDWGVDETDSTLGVENNPADPCLSAILVVEEETERSEVETAAALEMTETATVLQGVSIPQSESEPPKKNLICCNTDSTLFNLGSLALFFVVFLALVLGLTLGNPNKAKDDPNPTSLQDPQPDQDPADDGFVLYPPYRDGLPGQTLSALQDPSSPQYKANAWMMEDPFLENYPEWRRKQRFALVVKYFAMNGDHWFENYNWLSYEVSECDWWSRNAKPCNDRGEFEVEDLRANNLTGTIPFEGPLESIRYVDNSNNHLQGGIPPVRNMSKLEVFILSNNNFGGPIPVYSGFNAFNLRVLKVDGNALEGKYLSGFLPLLPKLEIINFKNNKFSGSLPKRLATSCKDLSYLGMGGNDYVGTIPSELGMLSSLQELILSENPLLTGIIPTELAFMDRLSNLDVSGTSLSGSIPNELCRKTVNLVNYSGGTTTTTMGLSVIANCSRLQCCPPL